MFPLASESGEVWFKYLVGHYSSISNLVKAEKSTGRALLRHSSGGGNEHRNLTYSSNLSGQRLVAELPKNDWNDQRGMAISMGSSPKAACE